MNKNIKVSAKIYILVAIAISITLVQYYYYNLGQERQSLLQTFFIITSRFKNETSELKYKILKASHDGQTDDVIKHFNELFKTIKFSVKYHSNTDIDYTKKENVINKLLEIEKVLQMTYEDYINLPKNDANEFATVIDQIEKSLSLITELIIDMVEYTDRQTTINQRINVVFSLSSVLIVIVILIVIIVPQILQLENLNAELTSSNILRESIQNSSPNAILFIRDQKVYLLNNKVKEVINFLAGKEINEGDHINEYLPDKEIQTEFEKGLKESEQGNLYRGSFSFIYNGEKYYYKILFYPVFDSQANYFGTTIIFTDISHEILAQQKLAESEQYYKTMIDNSHGIIFTLTDQLHIKFASKAVEEFLKTKTEDLKGIHFLSIVKEIDKAEVQKFLENALNKSDEADSDFVQFSLKSGRNELILLGRCGVIHHEDSREILLLCIDITSKIQYEIKLQEQNKKLTEIAWLQSHVIRRPVANALGICELLLNDQHDSNLQQKINFKEFVNLLYQEIKNIDEVIHRINEKTQEL